MNLWGEYLVTFMEVSAGMKPSLGGDALPDVETLEAAEIKALNLLIVLSLSLSMLPFCCLVVLVVLEVLVTAIGLFDFRF